MDNIFVNTRSSIQITGTQKIYFDPYCIEGNPCDADAIFITHEHFDHFSPEDIKKVMKSDTQFFIPTSMKEVFSRKVPAAKYIEEVLPWQQGRWQGLTYQGIPAYNIDKEYHLKNKNWLGYLVEIDGVTYYAMGDTDVTPEAMDVDADVTFVPIGGKYTMDVTQAIEFINRKGAKVVVPIHYSDGETGKTFKNSLNTGIETIIFW